jgi:hypothetical protein
LPHCQFATGPPACTFEAIYRGSTGHSRVLPEEIIHRIECLPQSSEAVTNCCVQLSHPVHKSCKKPAQDLHDDLKDGPTQGASYNRYKIPAAGI